MPTLKTNRNQSQGAKRFVSTCSVLLALCWIAIAVRNLSQRAEALNAFSVGVVVAVAVVFYLIPKAIAKVVFWMKGSSRTNEAIREMQAMRAAKDDLESAPSQSRTETGLPEAWTRLVRDGDNLLLNLVAEKAKSLQGSRPTRAQVLEFLKGLQGSEALRKDASDLPTRPEVEQAASPAGRKPPENE